MKMDENEFIVIFFSGIIAGLKLDMSPGPDYVKHWFAEQKLQFLDRLSRSEG